MKILKTAVVVKLDDGKVYQLAVSEKQADAIHDLISLTNKSNKIDVIDKPISGIDLD